MNKRQVHDIEGYLFSWGGIYQICSSFRYVFVCICVCIWCQGIVPLATLSICAYYDWVFSLHSTDCLNPVFSLICFDFYLINDLSSKIDRMLMYISMHSSAALAYLCEEIRKFTNTPVTARIWSTYSMELVMLDFLSQSMRTRSYFEDKNRLYSRSGSCS